MKLVRVIYDTEGSGDDDFIIIDDDGRHVAANSLDNLAEWLWQSIRAHERSVASLDARLHNEQKKLNKLRLVRASLRREADPHARSRPEP